MFENIKLSLRGYSKEPFTYLETIDCKERTLRWKLSVIERKRTLQFFLNPWAGDNVFEILEKVEKETEVLALVLTDYEKHIHYYKELHK